MSRNSDELVFEGNGVTVVRRNRVLMVRYESGESAGSTTREDRISEEEVEKIMRSEQDAYKVLLAIEQRKGRD
jgi:hypothetical protein